MKKLLSVILMCCMIIYFASPVFGETGHEVGNKKANNRDEKPKLSFNVLSDTHIRDTSFSQNNFLAALQDLHEADPNTDAMVINGDMTNTGFPKEYSIIRELLEQSPKPEKTYFSIGNHEFHNEEGNEVNIQRFTSFVDQDHVYYEKLVKGYSFIFLGSEGWGPVDSPIKDAARLSEKQLNWLEHTLKKRSKNNKPIFVYLHQPLPDTFGEGPMVLEPEKLEKILSKYPQVVLFSSHTHQDMRLPNTNMMEKGFPIVNTGAVYYTTFWPTQNWDESQGLHVQVYGDKVEIMGRDFNRKQWIPETYYSIDVPSKTTFSFGGQYLFPGVPNKYTSTFTNYGQKTIKDIDLKIHVPNGWKVKAISDTHLDRLLPGNSMVTDWLVTPPNEVEKGFTRLNVNASIKYNDKKKKAKISTNPMIRIVPSPPKSDSYLSDIEWTDATNYWGPVERDQSVGEKEQNDGKTITIGGVHYKKGLGVHAISEVSYHLGGHFTTFTSDVGVDDEEGNKGSVVFQVWTDGKKIYDSGVVTGSQSAKKVNVDISGANELKLRVIDADDGRKNDHADWADAKISGYTP